MIERDGGEGEVEAAMHGDKGAPRQPVDVAEALLDWLANGARTKYAKRFPSRMGVRCVALLWVLHPERMPWAPGQPQSARQVAKAIGLSQAEFYRITGDVSRRLGFSNRYQDHAWQRKGKESFKGKPNGGAGTERRSRE